MRIGEKIEYATIPSKYSRFWLDKGCTCPKMDNEDRFGTGYFIINLECPIHSSFCKSNEPEEEEE